MSHVQVRVRGISNNIPVTAYVGTWANLSTIGVMHRNLEAIARGGNKQTS